MHLAVPGSVVVVEVAASDTVGKPASVRLGIADVEAVTQLEL